MIEWIVSSSVLILAVIGLRALFRGRISRRMIYGLWLLALLRLLIPGSLAESAVSVANLVRELTPEPVIVAPVLEYEDAMEQVLQQHSLPKENYEQLPEDTRSQYIQQAESLVEASRQEVQTQQTQAKRQTDVKKLLVAFWLIGAALTALALLSANIRFARMLKRSREKLDYPAILPVYQTGLLQTPCLFGRTVYLPRDSKAGDIPYILAHELTHYRQGDHIWSALRCVCLAVHWYNPLVWIAAKLSRNDSELACDEGTLERLGEESREAYGKVLIEMSRGKTSVEDLLLTATTMTGDKQTLYARVKAIAKKPRVLIWAVAITLAAAAVVVGCTFTGAKNPEAPTEPPETQETTTPPESLPEALVGVPVLEQLPWKFIGSIGTDDSYDAYFQVERSNNYHSATLRTRILSGSGAYYPVAVSDWLCIRRETENDTEIIGIVGTESYPGLYVIGTDQYYFYCISGSELFRLDVYGNKETIYTDSYGTLPIDDETAYALTDDRMMMVFVANAGTDYGIYRVYLNGMRFDLLTLCKTRPTDLQIKSNYQISWTENNEAYSLDRIPAGITPQENSPQTTTEPPATEPPTIEEVAVKVMGMLYVPDPEAGEPAQKLPSSYYFLGNCYANDTEIPKYNFSCSNIPNYTEIYASPEDVDYIYYLGQEGYYRMIRAALTEQYKDLKGADAPIPEDTTYAFFEMLLGYGETPYNQCFDMVFYRPESVNIYYLFYRGFNEWEQRNVPLTQEEKDFLYANGWDNGESRPIGNAKRFPISAIDEQLRRFFGISYQESYKVGVDEYAHFLESTQCFYHWRSDTRGFPVKILSIRETRTGTFEITCEYDSYQSNKSVITLVAGENVFLIRSNVPA